LDVGWWLSVNDCDLHHPLHRAWSCEVLNQKSGESGESGVSSAGSRVHSGV